MNLLVENEKVQIDDSTAGTSEQVIFRRISFTPVHERGLSIPIKPIWTENDELQPFILQGARDILKEVGPISKEDYDYYESL